MIWTLLGQTIAGWLLADFLTGLFHWWEDTHPELVNAPVIGRWIIAPNILHHAAPLAFTRQTFWARNRDSIFAAAIVAVVWAAVLGPSVLMAATLIGGALSNEIHFYAHRPSLGSPAVRVLQQIGLMQSPKEHAAHHRPPHRANYCVMTDWLNPILEATGFWRRLSR